MHNWIQNTILYFFFENSIWYKQSFRVQHCIAIVKCKNHLESFRKLKNNEENKKRACRNAYQHFSICI